MWPRSVECYHNQQREGDNIMSDDLDMRPWWVTSDPNHPIHERDRQAAAKQDAPADVVPQVSDVDDSAPPAVSDEPLVDEVGGEVV